MAKEYRLVWNDQQGKPVVVQEQAHAERKQFAARIMASALAATALTTFGVSEARAEVAPECRETYTSDMVLAADTTTTGAVCYEKTLTIEAGATVANEINASLFGPELGFYSEVVNFASGTTSGNLINNGSILATFVPISEGQMEAISGAAIAFNGGNLVGDIINNGVIEKVGAEGGRAIRFFSGSMTGDLINTSLGTIEGGGGIDLASGFILDGSIKNDGQIIADSTTFSGTNALQVEGTITGSIENGLNDSGAMMYSANYAAINVAGTVSGKIINGGTIAGDGDYGAIYLDGDVTGGIENLSTGKITSREGEAGIYIYSGAVASIKNEGEIAGKSYGIYLNYGARLGSITNSGSIFGETAGIEYYSGEDGSTLTNSGTITGAADGVHYSNSTNGALTNSGTIVGGLNGVHSESGNIQGGITNLAGGVIEGLGSYGIYLSSGTLSGGIRNAGKITGEYDGIYLSDVVSNEDTTEGANIGDIVNEKGGEFIGVTGAGLYSSDSAIGKIDNAGTMRGERNGIYLSSSTVGGGIVNSGMVEGTQSPTDSKYDSNGLTITGSTVMGDIVNEATGAFVGGKNGIFITDESRVTGALINKGLISGGLSAGERIYSVNDAADALSSIVIDGDNTAQFVGAVNALNADMSVASGATYTVRDNMFWVKSFTNNGTTLFDSAAGAASLMLPDLDYGYVFQNKGTVSVAVGTIGQLTGNYVQDAAGTFLFNAAEGTVTNGVLTGDHGRLQVSGDVDLADGTTIKVNLPTTGLPDLKDGTRIEAVITAGGEMTATDSAITVIDSSRRYDFVASFDRASNELDLITLIQSLPILESVQFSSRSVALGAARVLEDMQAGTIPAAMEPVFDRLGELQTEAEIAAAVSQTLPAMLGATPQSLASGLRSANKFIQSRMEGNQGLSAGDVEGGKYLWGRAFGTWSKQNDRGDVSGFKSDTQGLVLGYDGSVSDSMRIGFAAAYANSTVKGSVAGGGHRVNVDSYELITFGSYNVAPQTDINYQFDIGVNKAKASRHIPFMDSTANARFSSFVLRGGLGAGHTLSLGDNTTLTPSARVDYTYMRTGDYTETGAGPLSLKVEASTYDELVLSSDFKLKHKLGSVDLTVNAGGGYDALNDDTVTVATFVGGGPAFTTTGLKVSPWLYRGGVGLSKNAEGMELSLRYDAEGRSSGYSNHTVSVRGRWSF